MKLFTVLNQAISDPGNEMELMDLGSASQVANPPVVYVRNAYKQYGSKRKPVVVLNGLDMTVLKGSIYGLLGASACGKTTLLNCILGQTNLNSGNVRVLGGPPGSKDSGVPGPRVGYMPQEIALFGDFTILETFKYFGTIADMDNKQIKERSKMLSKLLMLPETSQLVRSLSGGEQRRLSLASAIFYGPELLVLDEPTVGVDPLLRENIWSYLTYISREQKSTIIITTHYIEEARQAHIVGLMRGGKLLAEKPPEALLSQYGSKTLEEVFLKLSSLQSVDIAYNTPGSSSEYISASSSIGRLSNQNQIKNASSVLSICKDYDTSTKAVKKSWLVFKANHMKALIWKNILWWVRNLFTLAFLFGLSVLLMLLFCVCIGQEPRDLPIAVVNHETNNSIYCASTVTCHSTELSCNYLEKLKDKSIILTYFDSEDKATASVHHGKTFASIVVKHNYSAALRSRVEDGRDSGPWNLKYATMDVIWDDSNKLVADYIQLHMYDAYQHFFHDYLTSCDISLKAYDFPIKMEDPIYGTIFPAFADFAIPAALLTMVFYLAILLTSGAMLTESNEGSFERTFVLGITEVELITAHVVCEFVIMVIQSVLALVSTFCAFDVTLKGSLLLVVLLTVLTGFCGMCYGTFISCICSSYFVVTSMSMGILFPLILLSGVIWPLEGMHHYLQSITAVLPLTNAVDSMRSILQKNWGMDSYAVYIGYVTICIWALIFLTFSIVALKYKIRI